MKHSKIHGIIRLIACSLVLFEILYIYMSVPHFSMVTKKDILTFWVVFSISLTLTAFIIFLTIRFIKTGKQGIPSNLAALAYGVFIPVGVWMMWPVYTLSSEINKTLDGIAVASTYVAMLCMIVSCVLVFIQISKQRKLRAGM